MDLQKKIQHLFSTQRQAWKLLDDNCNQMSNIELKWLEWKNDAEVVLQYNPSRLRLKLTRKVLKNESAFYVQKTDQICSKVYLLWINI